MAMKRISYFLALSTIILFVSCNKDQEPVVPDTFDEVFEKAGSFDPVVNSETVTEENGFDEIINGEVWNCTTITYDAMTPGGGTNGFPLFNPNASVIYPGSLLQGKSLRQATPDLIVVERAGGSVSYDLINGNLSSSFTVPVVTKSSIQNAMNQIIANSPPDLPANFTFSYSQVQSESALSLKLGIDYENAFVDIQSSFGFSTGSSLNRILVELDQSFYTMSFDIPTSLDGLFAPSVTPADLAKYVHEGNPATYISDVTYGRIYYMLIESTSSYKEMETEINASFNGIINSASANIEGHSLNKLKNLKIKVMAFGGEATTSLLTIGETNLNNLVTLLAESTTISTGVPISYVVRSVYDNKIVSVQLATQYDVTNCEPASFGGEPAYTAHWKGEVLSRMGPVGAAYATSGTEFILIDINGTQFMRSNVGVLEGPFPISQLATGTPAFNAIGAACNIDGNNYEGAWIMIMDMTGSQYSYITGTGDWSSQINPITNLAEGNNPFNLNGIGAMAFNHKSDDGPSSRIMFNRDGNKYSLYTNNPNSFSPVYDISGFHHGPPFQVQRIGAMIGFTLGNQHYTIAFNHLGTEYAVLSDIDYHWLGPFDL
jgi:thiol-activated cytolysin